MKRWLCIDRRRSLATIGSLVAALFLLPPARATAADPDGAEIFKATCAACHGPEGQGTAKQKRRLEGDRSVSQLAEVIQKTMPEDDPGTLTAGEAQAVAAYTMPFIPRWFASENRGPRQLTRLTAGSTVALADVIGGFVNPRNGEASGDSAEYTRARFRQAWSRSKTKAPDGSTQSLLILGPQLPFRKSRAARILDPLGGSVRA